MVCQPLANHRGRRDPSPLHGAEQVVGAVAVVHPKALSAEAQPEHKNRSSWSDEACTVRGVPPPSRNGCVVQVHVPPRPPQKHVSTNIRADVGIQSSSQGALGDVQRCRCAWLYFTKYSPRRIFNVRFAIDEVNRKRFALDTVAHRGLLRSRPTTPSMFQGGSARVNQHIVVRGNPFCVIPL